MVHVLHNYSLSAPTSPLQHLLITMRLLSLFLASKAAQFVLLSLVPAQFDTSSQILLSHHRPEKYALVSAFPIPFQKAAEFVLSRVVDRLVVWDAVYFSHLFTNGITYEHENVFCPLWWRLVSFCSRQFGCHNFYSRFLCATLLSCTAHYAATLVLGAYTRLVFQDARLFSPQRMARAAQVVFVISPAGIFLTAPYAELAAALCSFACLYLRESGTLQGVGSLYVASGIFAALAYGMRANCLLLGGVYLWDVAWPRTAGVLVGPGLTARRIWALAAGCILGASFVASNVANYVSVCSLGRGEWCDQVVPSLFAYAQSHYWNVGFMRYWSANNIPNFMFAIPVVTLLVVSIRYFQYEYPVDRVLAVLAVNGLFVMMVVLFWHVQIVTRIHTFLPSVYWLMAGFFTQKGLTGARWGRWCMAYMVVWCAVQTAMFGAFLPPA